MNPTKTEEFPHHLVAYLESIDKDFSEEKQGFIKSQRILTDAMDPHGIIKHAVRETGITDPEALANYINKTILEELKSFGIHARIDPRSDQIAFTINGKHAMYYPSDLLALTKSEDTDNNTKIQTLRTQEAIAWENRIKALAGNQEGR